MSKEELVRKLKIIFDNEKRSITENKRTYSFEKLKEPELETITNQRLSVAIHHRVLEPCEVRLIPGQTKLIWKSYNLLEKLYSKVNSQDKTEILNVLLKVLLDSNPIEISKIDHDQIYIEKDIAEKTSLTPGFLALYFLIKHGQTTNALIALQNKIHKIIEFNKSLTKKSRKSNDFYGSDDIACYLDNLSDFLDELKFKLDEKDFRILKELAYTIGHPLFNNITEIEIDLLEKELDGVKSDIEEYREEVTQKIKDFDFNQDLIKAINLAYDKIKDPTNEDPSGEINKLREFFLQLRKSIGNEIVIITNDKIPLGEDGKESVGKLNEYLKEKLKLSSKDKAMIKAVSELQHVEGGHTLFSEKKYGVLILNQVLTLSYFLLETFKNFKEESK